MEKLMLKNKIASITGITLMLVATLSSCNKDEDKVEPATPVPIVISDPMKISYALNVKDELGVTGIVTFSEKSSASSESVVTIQLIGAIEGIHPAHIHVNSAIETGGIAYSLNSVDSTGKSTTTLSVSYATLVNFDGYVNVHASLLDLGTIIAQGDIGGNALTGDSKTFTLNQDSTSGIFGNAKFEKRKNGHTLVTVNLTAGGVLPVGVYSAQINLGSVATIGAPYSKKRLQNVDDATRRSFTNIRTLDDSTPITYNNWLVYDGFITIHDASDNSNVIAKGNIGAN